MVWREQLSKALMDQALRWLDHMAETFGSLSDALDLGVRPSPRACSEPWCGQIDCLCLHPVPFLLET